MFESCLPVSASLTITDPVKFYFCIIFRFRAGVAMVTAATNPEKKHPTKYQNQESVEKLNEIINTFKTRMCTNESILSTLTSTCLPCLIIIMVK